MSRFHNDPYDITARFGQCSVCGRPVKGEKVLYFPRGKKVQCYVSAKCSDDNEKVKSSMFDEDFFSKMM